MPARFQKCRNEQRMNAIQPITRRWFGLTAALVCALAALGCQQEMAQQPSYRPLEPSDFFPDGRSARPLVAGTVARGQLPRSGPLMTGIDRTRRGTASAAAFAALAQNGLLALAVVPLVFREIAVAEYTSLF